MLAPDCLTWMNIPEFSIAKRSFNFHADFDANSCPPPPKNTAGADGIITFLLLFLGQIVSFGSVFCHLPVTALVSPACLESSDCCWSSPAGQEARRTWTPPRACFSTSTLMGTRPPTRLKPGIRPVKGRSIKAILHKVKKKNALFIC